MRKIIAHMAVSADGFIARKNGAYDWLERPMPKGNYGMGAFVKSIDTIVWGRKTYDQTLALGHDPSFGPKIRNYVFTHRKAEARPNFEFTREPVRKFAGRLRAERGKNIWMMGGGEVIASFLDAGEIDEFSMHVIPVMIGEGIPLVAAAKRTVELKLLASRRYADGVVHLRYEVPRAS